MMDMDTESNAAIHRTRTQITSDTEQSFELEFQVGNSGKIRVAWVRWHKHIWRHSNMAAHTVNSKQDYLFIPFLLYVV